MNIYSGQSIRCFSLEFECARARAPALLKRFTINRVSAQLYTRFSIPLNHFLAPNTSLSASSLLFLLASIVQSDIVDSKMLRNKYALVASINRLCCSYYLHCNGVILVIVFFLFSSVHLANGKYSTFSSSRYRMRARERERFDAEKYSTDFVLNISRCTRH